MSVILLVTTMLLMSTITPMKVAFFLTMLSLVMSVLAYSLTSSMFTSAAIVISFSSGMMILFCYCSMMSSYESKNQAKKYTMMLTILSLSCWSTWNQTSVMSTEKKMLSWMNSPLIMTMMFIVVMAMISINKSMIMEKKNMMVTYLWEKETT